MGLNVTLQKECPVSSLGLMVAAIRSITLSLLIIAPLIWGACKLFPHRGAVYIGGSFRISILVCNSCHWEGQGA